MTLKEIYELIKQKKENAERDLIIMTSNDKKYNQCLCIELKGAIEAYEDVLILLGSSCLIEPELKYGNGDVKDCNKL